MLGLTLVAVLLLTACKKDVGKIEPPDVVLSKSITQASKVYEEEMNFDIDFSDATKKNSGNIKMSFKGKNNSTDAENIQSELSIDGTANIKADQGGEKGQGKANIAFAGSVKSIGQDIYASLTKLDLDGDVEGIEEAKATLPVFVGPYMNETVKLPLGEMMNMMEEINKKAQLQGQPSVDYQAMKKYGLEQGPKDLADSKIFVVTKDLGIEKIKSLGGKKVQAYHYEIGINGEGLKTFIKKMGESTQILPKAEMQELMKEENNAYFTELADVLNQAVTIHVWIGQTDYQTYKTEITSDLKKIKAALDQINELEGLDKESVMTDSEKEFFEKGNFSLKITDERNPLSSFSAEKPSDKDVIDLGPMLKVFMNQVVNEMSSDLSAAAGGDLSEEQLQQMMQGSGASGMSEEEMQKMMDSLSATPAQ